MKPSPPSPGLLLRALGAGLVALCPFLALGALASCEGAAGPEGGDMDEAAIAETIRSYLPRLGTAYATGNFLGLNEFAVPKEVARVEHQRALLAGQGKVYEPEFKELVVEKIRQWKHSNAFATTVEVWDVRSYSLGGHVLLSEVTNQRNRVKYQLKRKQQGWVILYRELVQPLSSD